MLLALGSHGKMTQATPQETGWCPSYNGQLIPKCGHINIWHWAHKNNEESCNYKPESEWHLKWKTDALAHGNDIEIKIGNHISDILNRNSNRLIELQNSSLGVDEMIDRCEVFSKNKHMVDWIFNFRPKYQNDQLNFIQNDGYHTFKQKWQKKVLWFLFDEALHPKYGRVWLDIGEINDMFLIHKLYSTGGGWGRFAKRDSPITRIRFTDDIITQ